MNEELLLNLMAQQILMAHEIYEDTAPATLNHLWKNSLVVKDKRVYLDTLQQTATELEDKVEEQNDELFEVYTERDNLREELKEEQELREKIDKYLNPQEKEELAEKIEQREKEEQEKIKQKRQGYWR